jgi:hypothetical protein
LIRVGNDSFGTNVKKCWTHHISVCQEILSESSLKIRKGGSACLCRFGIVFTIIGFKIQYLSLLKYRGYLIYPVRNNAPLEFLTGFTSGAIFSIIFMIALRSAVPIGTEKLQEEPVTG